MSENTCKLVIVGSGPHSLSLVTRLLSEYPASLYTDDQHERILHHINKSSNSNHSKPNNINISNVFRDKKVRVIDGSGGWMHRWTAQFSAYGINQLRSPVFFHPDPIHKDALRAYATSHGRLGELHEYADHLFDNSARKYGAFNERDRLDFGIPSAKLFRDFCSDLVSKSGLDGVVDCDIVKNIEPLFDSDGNYRGLIRVHCENGGFVNAQNVVVATGTLNRPNIPKWAAEFYSSNPAVVHSMDLLGLTATHNVQTHFDVINKTGQSTRVLIVGGGLTSAHLVCLAHQKYKCPNITQVARSFLKVKHFDANLEWVGRYKNVKFANFYQQTFEERLKCIKEARGGGSITPHMRNKLRQLEESKCLDLLECHEITECVWLAEEKCLKVTIKDTRNIDSPEKSIKVDAIWLATGSLMDIKSDPLFTNVNEKFAIETVQGLPCLRHDLSWSESMPNLYVMGGYAALQLGPNALNLIGGKAGSDRIAETLDLTVKNGNDDELTSEGEGENDEQFVFGDSGNFYALLDNLSVR